VPGEVVPCRRGGKPAAVRLRLWGRLGARHGGGEGTRPQPGTRYPCCIGGRGACPPEDVGGPWGYQGFLAAVADAGHDEHEQWIEWVGGGFDPDAFDVASVDKALDVFAWAEAPVRRAGPTS
jgi:hypothetical protein